LKHSFVLAHLTRVLHNQWYATLNSQVGWLFSTGQGTQPHHMPKSQTRIQLILYDALQAAKIPLTPLQVDQLIGALDQDGDGEIDFG